MTEKTDHTPKKVLFVLPSLNSGGAERVLITLMNGTSRLKYDRQFITVSEAGELRHLINSDIPYHSLNRQSVLFCLPALYKKIKELKPDIVISTMVHMNFAVLTLAPFFPQTRFIVREAITPSFLFKKYKKMAWLIKGLYLFLYPRASLILSPTRRIFIEFQKYLNTKSDKFTVLPNPINVQTIREHQDPVIDTKPDPEVISFVACGRLVPQKGFDRLIKLMAETSLEHKWHLTILGEGQDRECLEQMVRDYELTNKVSMPGLIAKPYGYFAKADYFLLPSRFEGSPNVVLEALATGTPVIATSEAGGVREIAAAAQKHAIQVAHTMDEFKDYVNKTNPQYKDDKPSLLPEKYIRENVIHQFNDILDNIAAIR